MSAPRRRSTEAPALHAIGLQARRLAAAGQLVELHGSVVHNRISAVIPGLCLGAAMVAVLGMAWPRLAAAVCLLAIGALTADLDGERSAVRWMWPRRPHRTLLLGAPRPRATPPDHHVLVVIPDEVDHPAGARHGLLVPAALFAAAAGPMLASGSWDQATAALGIVAAIACTLAAALQLWPRRPEDPSSGLNAVERLRSHLDDRPHGADPHVTVALVGGLSPWHDGLETLLLNHTPRLSRASTIVLVWAPSTGPIHAIAHEGLLRRGAASPAVLEAARSAGIPIHDHTPEATAARRARRLGWRALAFGGGLGEAQAMIAAIDAMVAELTPPARS